MSKTTVRGYIVDHKANCDDDITVKLVETFPVAKSRNQAWKNFLGLVGKDRDYWNKLGYTTTVVSITIEMVKGEK